MRISFAAMNRMLEEKMATDPDYRRRVERNHRATLSAGRALSDDELVEKLHSLGLTVDRPTMAAWTERFPSAEALTRHLSEEEAFKTAAMDEDWVWIGLAVLWEQWFPDKPSFEMIDDRMQAGYKQRKEGDTPGACETWLGVWRDVLSAMDSLQTETIGDFDEVFGGMQCVFNWMQDLDMELGNAGRDNPRFYQERIAVCQDIIQRHPDDELTFLRMQRAIAESHFELGHVEQADSLFQQWLTEEPQWGWGWIGWSDCYAFTSGPHQDDARAEEILKRGLAVEGVSERADLVDRLKSLYEDQGRTEEAEALWEEIDASDTAFDKVEISRQGNVTSLKTTLDFGEEGLPLEELGSVIGNMSKRRGLADAPEPKISRNQPCPCGSGRKYKKCCGKAT